MQRTLITVYTITWRTLSSHNIKLKDFAQFYLKPRNNILPFLHLSPLINFYSNFQRKFNFLSILTSPTSLINCICSVSISQIMLRPFQIVLLASSCGAGRREIRRIVGRRVQGISPCVPSFYTVSQLRELRNYKI